MDRRTILLGISGWQPMHPHPADAFAGDLALTCRVARDGERAVIVEYRLEGDLSAIVVPDSTGARRVDDLWKTTCLELFLAGAGEAYGEYNMAPGGAWAAYEFEAYRNGGRDALVRAPEVDWQMREGVWHVEARLSLPDALVRAQAPLRASVCAVIEWQGGGGREHLAGTSSLSYWATQHVAPRPDFHARESFILELGSPS